MAKDRAESIWDREIDSSDSGIALRKEADVSLIVIPLR
jgi:hypothetical protein